MHLFAEIGGLSSVISWARALAGVAGGILLKQNECTLLVGPPSSGAPVWIHQQAYISRAQLDSNHQFNYQLKSPGNGVYIMNIAGKVSIDRYELNNRDALGVSESNELIILSKSESDLLFIEVPMHF